MARSNSSNDTALGCAALLGIAVLGVVCWLVWSAVMWLTAEWRWAWICGCALLVPGLAYAVVRAWGEQRPFVPAVRREAWITAVLTAVAAAAPVVVLAKGWGTGIAALLLAACAGEAVIFLSERWSPAPFRSGRAPTPGSGDAPHVSEQTPAD
jgi:small-conductance mechanosensitive channel